jgi:phosphoglycerate dehydrogenase-like enzyme
MRPHTLLAMDRSVHQALRLDGALDRLREVATVDPELLISAPDGFTGPAADAARLGSAEVLFTHWGCPPLTAEALERMPALRAVVHAAGSVKHHVTEAVWQRGISVSTAAEANARPVAEYTLAAILFANKRVLDSAREYRQRRGRAGLHPYRPGLGNYRRTIGIVGASRTGRQVIGLLGPFDFTVLVHDPYLSAADAAELGAVTAGLDELVRRSDVVSIHAPQLPETRHMFDARRLGLLREDATLINTARGSLVDTEALTRELSAGRIHAVLDVTDPEVLPAGSPLYELPNVLLTPHIAGSLGNELGRMADAAIAELGRFAQGLPFAQPIGPAELSRSA